MRPNIGPDVSSYSSKRLARWKGVDPKVNEDERISTRVLLGSPVVVILSIG
jgi:hypothetical protein